MAPAPPPDSWLRRLPAGPVFVGALVIVLLTALIPLRYYVWHLSVGLLLAGLLVLVKVPLRRFAGRLLLCAPVIAGACLTAALNQGQGPGWVAVLIRSLLCLSTMIVLASLVPFSALPGLLRRAHLPTLLVTILTLLHRYLYVLGDEAARMRRARVSRSLKPGGGSSWLLSAGIISRLFVRASERAERVYLAMCSRGWK